MSKNPEARILQFPSQTRTGDLIPPQVRDFSLEKQAQPEQLGHIQAEVFRDSELQQIIAQRRTTSGTSQE